LIPRLKQQEYQDFEIIIADDRSDDGTYEFIAHEAKFSEKLRVIRVKNKPDHINGKKFALYLGIESAKNSQIVLTDADCEPNSNLWLKSIANGFTEGKSIVIGYSQYLKRKGLLNHFIRYETLITGIQYIGMALLGKPYMGIGRNLAYKKSFFIENKGFNGFEEIVGGDDDLFINKYATSRNCTIALGYDAITLSQPKESIKDYFYQKIRHLSVGKYYKAIDKIILGIFILTTVGFWILIIPLMIAGFMPFILLTAVILKILLMTLLFSVSLKKLGDRINLWGIVILDIIFAYYYIFIGFSTLFAKRIKWI